MVIKIKNQKLEIEKIIKNKTLNINIICISKNTATLQKAERSKRFNFFKLRYLDKKKINKIKKAEQTFFTKK